MSQSLPLILVVDDEEEIRDLLTDILTLEDYEVVTAATGLEAILLLDLGWVHPSLVLLDLEMPVVDGGCVARVLRSTGHTAPLVLMTAARHGSAAAAELAADAFLAKPFDLDDLLATVSRLIGPRPIRSVA
jgi:DNA-binding response OmpR family regulator